MAGRPFAVVLLSFGGPEQLEEIPAFLESLLGRTPPPALLAEVTERYRLLGGGSPLPELTRRQAAALERELAARGREALVVAAMRHARPRIEEAAERLGAARDGAGRPYRLAVGLSLTPFRSRRSTGEYEEGLARALAAASPGMALAFPGPWHLHSLYLDALARRLEETLAGLPARERETVPVIFTAHSLPERLIAEGDPYLDQLRQTAAALAGRLGLRNWHLGFQSRSALAREPWLGPEVEELLRRAREGGATSVVVDPIGFPGDHLETLYDNDHLHRREAERLGLRFLRVPCLNLSKGFIAALAAIAEETAGRAGA